MAAQLPPSIWSTLLLPPALPIGLGLGVAAASLLLCGGKKPKSKKVGKGAPSKAKPKPGAVAGKGKSKSGKSGKKPSKSSKSGKGKSSKSAKGSKSKKSLKSGKSSKKFSKSKSKKGKPKAVGAPTSLKTAREKDGSGRALPPKSDSTQKSTDSKSSKSRKARCVKPRVLIESRKGKEGAPLPPVGVVAVPEKSKSKRKSRSKSKEEDDKSDKQKKASVAAVPKSEKKKRDVRPLEMQPAELNWKPNGGVQEVKLQNPGADRFAFKVKTSDTLLYRVSPVYGFVEPHEDHKNGAAKTDKLVIVTVPATQSDRDAKTLFKDSAADDQKMLVLPLIAA